MVKGLRHNVEAQFFAELFRANRPLAVSWYGLILLRGLIPAAIAVSVGLLIARVQEDAPIGGTLAVVAVLFVVSQILPPLHAQISASLGSQISAWLDDQLLLCTTTPAGLGHLESSGLTDDLTLARDFDLGLTGPPVSLAMGFIGAGLVDLAIGLAQVIVLGAYHWWLAALVGGAWVATHWMLRTATVWDRLTGELADAQRQAEYSYRLAMDSPAAKEVRLFGLSGWIVDRFTQARRRLVEVRWRTTRLPAHRVALTVVLLVGVNGFAFWWLARDAGSGAIGVGAAVTFAQAAVGAAALGFGGLSWALPHAAHGVATVRRLREPMLAAGALATTGKRPADARPAREIQFRDVRFAYADGRPPVLDGLNLSIPAGSSLAVVGVNGAGKTTLVKLLSRLYDPDRGGVEIDGVDLREFDIDSWRSRVAAVFQDYNRYDLSLRENVAPLGSATDDEIRAALAEAGATGFAELDTVLSSAYEGGKDLSGGQWQRVALARVLCSVRRGAGLVILDEPTAQLDVRGEAEIFERLLAATRGTTTVLISHRFSTVRHADRIAVLEHGQVVEFGTHDELHAAGGRYARMYDIQAARFGEDDSNDHDSVFA